MFRLFLVWAIAAAVAFALPLSGQEDVPPATSLRALTTADAARAWGAVGRLDTGVSFCTATLIAPDLVLTAAHCLFSRDGRRLPDAALTFSASLRFGYASALRAIHRSHLPEGYAYPVDGADLGSVGQDLALLELDRAIATTSVRPMLIGARVWVDTPVTLVSYGAERDAYPSIEEACRVLSQSGAIQVLSCHVVSGSSGAPVIHIGPDGPEIVAVVSGRSEVDGQAVSVAVVADALLADLSAARAAEAAGVMSRSPGAVRRLTLGDSGRETSGARFVRP